MKSIAARLKGLWAGLLIGFLAVTGVGMMVTRNLALEGTYTYLRLFNEALSLIRSSYVDEVRTDDLMKGAYQGMLSELDPFSEYFTAEDYQDYTAAERAPKNRVDAGMRVARREGSFIVVAVKPGSDAESSGITPGDYLRRVGGQSTRELTLHAVDSMLSGRAGTTVAISVARREEPRKIDTDLTRRDVELPAPTLDLPAGAESAGSPAVLTIRHFGAGAADQIAAGLERAERHKVGRLLIDLRGNAWGSMDEAARAAGLFVGDTVVAKLVGKEGTVRELRSGRRRAAWSGVTAVLLNAASAEPAELFAAALADLASAPLMGERSFGVGAEQEFIPLKNGGWLRLSTRKYTSPSGKSWHGKGLEPATAIRVAQENLTPAERLSRQLKEAVEALRRLEPGAGSRAGARRAAPAESGGGL